MSDYNIRMKNTHWFLSSEIQMPNETNDDIAWFRNDQRVKEGADLQLSYDSNTGNCELTLNEVFLTDAVCVYRNL